MAKPDPRLLERDRYPERYELTTRFQDVDPNRHINNVAIAALFEDVRVRFDWGLGLQKAMEAHGLRTMIASLGIEYLGEAFYPDPVVAYAGGLALGRSSWSIGAILTQGVGVTAFMRSTVVCVAEGVPTPLPAEFRAAVERSLIRMEGSER